MSTRFDRAFAYLMQNEGGYSNNPLDKGGPTNFGITQASLTRFNEKHNEGLPDRVEDLTLGQAKVIYELVWWEPGFESIYDERIAIKIFDHHVNMDDGEGSSRAVKLAQQALNQAPQHGEPPLEVDGILGPKTIGELNETSTPWFMLEYKRQLMFFYRSLNQPHFIKGWAARTLREPK